MCPKWPQKRRRWRWRAREKMAMEGSGAGGEEWPGGGGDGQCAFKTREMRRCLLRGTKRGGEQICPQVDKKKRNKTKGGEQNRIFMKMKKTLRVFFFWGGQQRLKAKNKNKSCAHVENSFCWYVLIKMKQTCTHFSTKKGALGERIKSLRSKKDNLKANDGRENAPIRQVPERNGQLEMTNCEDRQ